MIPKINMTNDIKAIIKGKSVEDFTRIANINALTPIKIRMRENIALTNFWSKS